MTMQRMSIVALLVVVACSKGTSKNGDTPAVAASASTAAVVLAASVVAPANAPNGSGAWYVGTWKGNFAAARRASTTTAKEGGPGAWEKDDGQKLSGPGTLEVIVGNDGRVSGTLKGALGDLGLRGQIDGEELRANLVANSADPTAIHNGTLVLAHDSGALKGRLAAGSGDALAMRQADVTLKKAAP
jgi:hypothetical protein